MAGLTTHVLDTVLGRPAAGVRNRIVRTDAADGARVRIATARTNKDGRTDAPLIAARKARPGGSSCCSTSAIISADVGGRGRRTTGFLDVVPIRFSIADPSAHYHVPLVATPWSYSTYRGS